MKRGISASIREPINKALRVSILTRDKYTCQYCGRRAPDVELHIEHIVSVAQGGSNHPSNLCASCKDCNLGKGSRSLIAEVGRDELFFLDFAIPPLPLPVAPPDVGVPLEVIPFPPNILEHRLEMVRNAYLRYWKSPKYEDRLFEAFLAKEATEDGWLELRETCDDEDEYGEDDDGSV